MMQAMSAAELSVVLSCDNETYHSMQAGSKATCTWVHGVSNCFANHRVLMVRQVLRKEGSSYGAHIYFVLCCRQRRADLLAVE